MFTSTYEQVLMRWVYACSLDGVTWFLYTDRVRSVVSDKRMDIMSYVWALIHYKGDVCLRYCSSQTALGTPNARLLMQSCIVVNIRGGHGRTLISTTNEQPWMPKESGRIRGLLLTGRRRSGILTE